MADSSYVLIVLRCEGSLIVLHSMTYVTNDRLAAGYRYSFQPYETLNLWTISSQPFVLRCLLGMVWTRWPVLDCHSQ
jgi:hypothetical protein